MLANIKKMNKISVSSNGDNSKFIKDCAKLILRLNITIVNAKTDIEYLSKCFESLYFKITNAGNKMKIERTIISNISGRK